MRVIAGELKGRRLKAPAWEGLRPTSDKLRETLFNILSPRIQGARVLDAFAGTGAVGIEALSRGAAAVTFIDSDRRAVALVRENLELCGIADRHIVQAGDVASVVRQMQADALFDVIVLDPPYDMTNMTGTLEAVALHLAPEGVIVLERATRREPDIPAGLARARDVKSGDSSLTFLTRRMDTMAP